MSRYQYILFDLDGTLTDPALGITGSVIYALEKKGIVAPDRSELYCLIGPPLVDSFMKLWGMDEESARKTLAFYREYFSDKGIFENEVYEGIPEMLEALCAAGKKLCIATSKPEVYAKRILEHFGLDKYFTFIGGNTLEETRSQKSDVIRYIKSAIPELCEENAIMVGDRCYDVKGAHCEGLLCIGVLYGYGDKDELLGAGADYTAESIKELTALLLGGI